MTWEYRGKEKKHEKKVYSKIQEKNGTLKNQVNVRPSEKLQAKHECSGKGKERSSRRG